MSEKQSVGKARPVYVTSGTILTNSSVIRAKKKKKGREERGVRQKGSS